MKILSTVFGLLFAAITFATPLNNMIVFGDSLSDNGNLYEYMKHQLPVSPPYFEGRFSDGPVWVEHLIQSYYPTTAKDHMLNYAYGGAGVMEDDDGEDGFFTLKREMDSYFLSHQDKADPHSMYVVWIGSNNYLAVPDNPEKALSEVSLGIQHGLQRLVDSGAKHILVVTVPDLGRIPSARDFDAVDFLTYLAKQHNIALAKMVSDFQNQYPDVQWLLFDVNIPFNAMLNDPERYGFTNVMDTCYEEAAKRASSQTILKMVATVKPKPNYSPDACKGYLFFDPVHPAAQAHLQLAEATRKLLDENGVEFE